MSLLFDLVTFRPKRAIGQFTAQVTFSEDHVDEVTATEHPVERGAAITDHAYKNPAQLTIRAGWSNSSLAGLGSQVEGLLQGGISALGASYVSEVYAKLLALQAAREPIDIVTGKRRYQNMLMRSLAVTTDEKTENALMVTATFREIITVSTQATQVTPRTAQASPEKTAPIVNAGTKQLSPAPTANASALAILAGR